MVLEIPVLQDFLELRCCPVVRRVPVVLEVQAGRQDLENLFVSLEDQPRR